MIIANEMTVRSKEGEQCPLLSGASRPNSKVKGFLLEGVKQSVIHIELRVIANRDAEDE